MTDLIESEDELLDPQQGPGAAEPPRLLTAWRRLRDRTPLGGRAAGTEPDPRRRQRAVVAVLMTVAVTAGAGAAGVVVHSHDVSRDRTRSENRLLPHLVGGGATLTLGDMSPSGGITTQPVDLAAPLPVDFSITLRNDGELPLEVASVEIGEPGVDTVQGAPVTTIPPHAAAVLTAKIVVHCDAPDLPRSPTGVTLVARSAADKDHPAGKPATIPVNFDAGQSSDLIGSGSGSVIMNQQGYVVGSSVSSSFYRVCSNVFSSSLPYVTARVLSDGPAPSPQNPVVRYSLHMDGSTNAERLAVALPNLVTVPGLVVRTVAQPSQ